MAAPKQTTKRSPRPRNPVKASGSAKSSGAASLESPNVSRDVSAATEEAPQSSYGGSGSPDSSYGDRVQSPPGGRAPILRAGYTADQAVGPDRLGIEDEVDALAYVIASRDVEPPLSIGLFGDWGTGKSFFMSRLKQRIAQLAEDTAEVPTNSLFCSQIVQIDFNAWHYIEANLWASLVIRVFEGLASALAAQSGSDELQSKLLNELQSKSAAAAQAKAHEAAADRNLQLALLRKEETDKAFGDALLAVAADAPELNKAAKKVEESLGKPAGQLSLAEIERLAKELGTVGGGLRTAWSSLRHRRVQLSFLAAIVVCVGVVAGAVAWAAFHSALVGIRLAVIVSLLGLLGAFGRFMSGLITATNDLLGAIDSRQVLSGLRMARHQAATEAESAKAELVAAQTAVDEARRSEPATYRFVQDRYRSSDYRGELGIVALIQEDFKNLSAYLRPTANEGGPVQIERIVLYIDDLDRCPPKLVAKVLQAVHLLLAFPLFVVVVGVDSRWLVHSLQAANEDVLTPSGIEVGGSERDLWTSTPQNYLEKIFQIPYWIRPFEDDAYRNLVRALANIEDKGLPMEQETAVVRETPTPAQLQITPGELEFLETLGPLIPTPRAAKRLVNTYRLLRVMVPPLETQAFVGLGASEPVSYGRAGEYRAALILLAIVTGFPQLAGEVLRTLQESILGTWEDFIDSVAFANLGDSDEWERLHNALATIAKKQTANYQDKSLDPFKRWAPRVARYSFQAGRQFTGPGST